MIRALFVCHGNICRRSTMAEFVLKDVGGAAWARRESPHRVGGDERLCW